MQIQAILAAAAMFAMVPSSAASANLGTLGVKLFAPGLGAGANNQYRRAVPLDDEEAALLRREDSGFPKGIPQNVIDDCKRQTQDAQVVVTKQSGGLKAEKVPAECMSFATYFTDSASPHPCGTDCLQYESLNDQQIQNVVDAAKKNLPGAQIN